VTDYIAPPARRDRHAATGQELVSFTEVSLAYGRRPVLSGLTFALHQGDYVGIVGPNGAGKTTLLRALLGLLRPRSGRIEMPCRPLRCGYVPQLQTVDEIFPLTVLEIVLMGRYGRLGPCRRPRPADRGVALAALEEVGIADLAGQLYRDLSGGQRQRTLMARALACDPDLLVLDEPTNDMDLAGEHATMALVDRLQAERQLTVVMVSHYLNVVVNHVRLLALLGNGDFRLLPTEQVLEAGHLQKLYGMPIEVAEVRGRRVVVAAPGNGERP